MPSTVLNTVCLKLYCCPTISVLQLFCVQEFIVIQIQMLVVFHGIEKMVIVNKDEDEDVSLSKDILIKNYFYILSMLG